MSSYIEPSTVDKLSRRKSHQPEEPRRIDTKRSSEYLQQKINSWDFKVFVIDHLTTSRPLFHIGLYLIERHGLVRHFNLDQLKLRKCLDLIERSYRGGNAYHNSIHAADVVQALHCIISQPHLRDSLTKLEILAAIFAAAGHDVDHPGVNQPFLVTTKDYLAVLYKQNSVLENHHWRLTVSLIRESGLLEYLPSSDVLEFEETVKVMIMATDISRQREILEQFRVLRLEKSSSAILDSPVDRSMVLRIVIKCADISNSCRTWRLSQIWAQRCAQEFFNQGDRERNLQIPITTLCDRHNNTLPNMQISFIEYLVKPLFQEWQLFFDAPLTRNLTNNLTANLNKWRQMAQSESEESSQSGDSPAVVESQSGFRFSNVKKIASEPMIIPESNPLDIPRSRSSTMMTYGMKPRINKGAHQGRPST